MNLMTKNISYKFVLWAAFILTVCLRLPSVFQELPPYLYCDEGMFSGEVLRMLTSDTFIVNDFRAGGVNVYPVLILFKLWGIFSTELPSLSDVVVVGRLVHVVSLSSLAVFFIFHLTNNLFDNKRIGLYAVLGFVISPMVYGISRYWYPDHYIVVFASGFLFFLSEAFKYKPTLKSSIGIGVFWALTVSTKYTGLLFAIPIFVLMTIYLWENRDKDKIKKAFSRSVVCSLIILAAFTLVFSAFNFSLFVNTEKFVADFMFNINNYSREEPKLFLGFIWEGAKFYFLTAYVMTLGIAGFLVFSLGYLGVLLKSKPLFFLLTCFPAFLIIYLGNAGMFINRNMMILLPFILPVFGYGLFSIHKFSLNFSGKKRILIKALLALVVIFPSAQTGYAFIHDFQPDSRVLAHDWVNKHIPAGATIGMNEFCSGYSPAANATNRLAVDPHMQNGHNYYVLNSYWRGVLDPVYRNRLGVWQVIDQKYLWFHNGLDSNFYRKVDKSVTINSTIPNDYKVLKVFDSNGPDIVILEKK